MNPTSSYAYKLESELKNLTQNHTFVSRMQAMRKVR